MKDYKKILEGVVNIINTAEKSDIGFANICTYIGENCPELAESEDERIKKMIINTLNRDKILTEDEAYDCITWFEKQGQSFTKKDVDDAYLKGICDAKYELEKQGEQNPPEMITPEESLGVDSDTYNKIVDECIYGDDKPATMSLDEAIEHCKEKSCGSNACALEHKQLEKWLTELKELKEQKSVEWSENRSKELSLSLQIQAYLNTASDELYAKGKPLYSEKRIEDIHKCMLMWLKLHNTYFYQKPTWSEEDKVMLESIIVDFCSRRLPTESQESWLKSLRPQNNVTDEELAQAKKDAYNNVLDKIEYHSGEPTFDDGWSAAIWYLKKRNAQLQSTWKPSDEQMYNLSEAAHYNCAFFDMEILKGLYDDLKKLREE